MRKANLIQTAIWDDDEPFAELSADAKLVYLMLLTQSKVTAVGALDMAPKRWADSTSLPLARCSKALAELEQDDFIWTDQAKEELVIRTWVKHNVEGSPKMETAARDQFTAVSSRKLQHRLQTAYPSLFGSPKIVLPENTDRVSGKSDVVAGVEVQGVEVHSSSTATAARARVWSAYQTHHPGAKLTIDRKRLIENRLREGFSADQLVAAVIGNHLDPHCNGENSSGRQYHAFDLILRNADKIEQYAALATNGVPRPKPTTESGRSMEIALRLAEENQ